MHPQEALQLAHQELKRADHSIAVSLKYTRTVDVIKSIIERLINTIAYGMDALLAKAQKKTEEIPELPRLKIEAIKKLYPEDKTIQDFVQFYILLRKVDKAKFTRAQEYRRHVTMTAKLEDEAEIEVTIDIITDYYDRTKEFLQYVSTQIGGTNE